MGKKNKKTRWRAFTLNGHQSDSEESSTPSSLSQQNHRNYQNNKYYNSKFTYSSQSTPIRKYQNDSSKTTRSNSTTSDHKTTFNEDEYTRITTPRQDVLFKKGYLNKPKNYQTQISNGTSSTANSTSTCTPDHQSADGTEGTDLEYESQFVFPNGFIDHNGIYYINSYEPYPFVVYNTQLCFPEYQSERNHYSTDSTTDSVSPHSEEVVQNGGTQPPEYFYNNATASDNSNEESRKPKKKRRRKISRTIENGDISCDTDSSEPVLEVTETFQTTTIQEETSSKSNVNELDTKPSDDVVQVAKHEDEESSKCPLKPDAEEFVPRTFAYEQPNIQFVNFAPGYISVPYINHNPTFLPPGIPINYVPVQEPKFVNVVVPPAKEQPNEGEAEAPVMQNEPLREKPPVVESPSKKTRFRRFRSKPTATPENTTTAKKTYSTTVRKNVEKENKPCARYQKTLEVAKPRQPNQWISVSRRKKRKGDVVDVAKEDEPVDDGLFESFDVDLLEDVVPRVEVCEKPPTPPEEPAKIQEVKEVKRKAKKPPAKRVIVTDVVPPQVVEKREPDVPEPLALAENVPATPEKKKSKKKKKVVKPPHMSVSSSTTTLSNFDETYDFLLEGSITEDCAEKTNVEMSHAFDMLIQKGMFNSLEEKIKALNISASDDGFFKTINVGTFKPPATPSKQFFSSTQFEKLFQNVAAPAEKPSTIFLENPTVNEIIKKGETATPPVDKEDHQVYPITQAVKNWLTKTRENTPDVELLKSPDAIYKEIGTDEEITMWSVSPVQDEQDSLSWEDELPKAFVPPPNGTCNGHVEECEDAIEIYESKYGKNEDYLKLKAEIEEQQKTVTRNFPRHGNLPYRAICCNIM